MCELISIKVITTPWLRTQSTASLPPWLSEPQMGSLRTAPHPNPAAMIPSGSKCTVCTAKHTEGDYVALERVRGTSAHDWVKAVDWGPKLPWQTL